MSLCFHLKPSPSTEGGGETQTRTGEGAEGRGAGQSWARFGSELLEPSSVSVRFGSV